MNDSSPTQLIISKTFKNLIPPLSPEEFIQLEQNLLKEGCRDPICVWNGIIIDGHNRYEICSRHEISFKTVEVNLQNENEVIAWICDNRIGRRNITEAARKYLIGKRYESEKVLGVANNTGKNQHFSEKEDVPTFRAHPLSEYTARRTSEKIGDEYQLSHSTVEKYAAYSRAIDILDSKNKEIVPKILSGHTKISHENVIELSKLPEKDLRRINSQMDREPRGIAGYSDIRNKHAFSREKQSIMQKISIKDMPKFDPDSEISSLTLTIPSWISLINRTLTATDFELVSEKAKNKLAEMLSNLRETANVMLDNIKE